MSERATSARAELERGLRELLPAAWQAEPGGFVDLQEIWGFRSNWQHHFREWQELARRVQREAVLQDGEGAPRLHDALNALEREVRLLLERAGDSELGNPKRTEGIRRAFARLLESLSIDAGWELTGTMDKPRFGATGSISRPIERRLGDALAAASKGLEIDSFKSSDATALRGLLEGVKITAKPGSVRDGRGTYVVHLRPGAIADRREG